MVDLCISDVLNIVLYDMVWDFGVEELVCFIGQLFGVIYNKMIKVESLYNQINVGDFYVWMKVMCNVELLCQLCNDLGGVFILVEYFVVVFDMVLLELIFKVEKEWGEFVMLLLILLEKGCIMLQVMVVLCKESMDVIVVELVLLEWLEGMCCVD